MNRVHLPLRHLTINAGTRAVLVGALATCAALSGPASAQDQPAALLKPPITLWKRAPVAPQLPESAPAQPSAAAPAAVTPPSASKPAPARVETLIRPATTAPAAPQSKPAAVNRAQTVRAQRPAQAAQPAESVPVRPSAAARAAVTPPSAPKPAPARVETLIRPATSAPAAPQSEPGAVNRAQTVRAQRPAQAAQPAVAPAAANTVAGVAKAPPPAVPSDFGAVARLLEFQASGLHAGPAQWISGRDASASYQRFLAGRNDAAPAGKQQGVGDYGMHSQTITQPAGVQLAPTGR